MTVCKHRNKYHSILHFDSKKYFVGAFSSYEEANSANRIAHDEWFGVNCWGHSKKEYPSEYGTWNAMLQRCYNKNVDAYKNYGGRGISVCSRWRKSFSAFFNDMGERPDLLTLDRLDNDGNYNASNCKWRDRSHQALNRRNRTGATGVRGISKQKRKIGFKYHAYYLQDGKRIHKGYFNTIEEAQEVLGGVS